MRVGIDVDGVLAEFCAGYFRVAADLGIVGPLERTMTTAEVKVWDWPTEQLHWSKRDEGRVWEEIKRRYNWWMTLEPLADITPQTVAGLNFLSQNHEVYYITSRPSTRGLSAERQTEYWLESIGVHVARRAHVIATRSGSKGALMDALDIALAIDDNVPNLVDIAAHGIAAACRSWQYNAEWPYARFATLDDFLQKGLPE